MKRLHLLCNAHLDPVWQWQGQEGVGAAITTFSAAADFCEEFGDFIFCHNEAVLYQWIEENDPALFERIKKLVEQKKWFIMGGWYLQPDCNMPSGESIVRQILAGEEYFKAKFPDYKRPDVAINFDSFGHSRGLVQILKDAGYKGYVCMRPESGSADRNFIWKGFAGSEIALYKVYGAYNTLLGQVEKKLEPFITKFEHMDTGMFLWGVGNHGGGPSRQDYHTIEELKKKYPQIEIIHSTPDAYFSEILAKGENLPASGELNFVNMGCYSSMIRIKQLHQKLENLLYGAEKMAQHARISGAKFDEQAFKRAQEDLLFNEFHDILPGSCIKASEDDAIAQLSHGIYETEKLRLKAFLSLAGGQPRATQGEYPVLVYNPHPFVVETTVECEFMLADQNWSTEEYFAVDAYFNGEKLDSQLEKEGSNLPLDWRKRLVFNIKMQPFSMNRVSVFTRLEPVCKKQMRAVEKDIEFDNGKLYVKIDAKSGRIAQLKVDGVSYLIDACGLRVIENSCDPWGFFYDSYTKVLGEFSLLDEKESARFAAVARETLPPVRVIEDGSVRTVVEVLFGYGNSRAVMQYILPKKGTQVKVHIDLFNSEKDVKLKLTLPHTLKDASLLGRTAFGMNKLPLNGGEVVAQDYVVTSDQEKAISVIHFGTYGLSATPSETDITLLNGSAYAAHPIDARIIMRDDRYGARIDQGERHYDFVINCSTAKERMEEIESESQIAHQPPYALNYFPTGNGEKCKQFMTISDSAVVLSAVKRAENGDGLILRLYNSKQKNVSAKLDLIWCGIQKDVEFLPYQFKTFLLKDGKLTKCNCLEEKI